MHIRLGFVVSRSLLALLAVISFLLVRRNLEAWALYPDFTAFWTAANDWKIAYDVTALTQAQAWLVDPSHGPRPFPYPPTALLIFLPFAKLPFWVAFWTWNVLGLAAFWAAARRIGSSLALLSPHVFLVLILGQTTLLIGAAIIWAVTLLERRAYSAGALLGAVAAVKPQFILLAPIALISGAYWKAIVGAALAFIAMLLAACPFGLWDDWLAAAGPFTEMVRHYRLDAIGVTPMMLATNLGLPPLPLQVAGSLAGVAIVWFGFRTKVDQTRLVCLICGSLLASPYGMRYDLAILSPVLVAGLLNASLRGMLGSVPLFAFHSITAVPALIIASIAHLSSPKQATDSRRSSAAG